jgi:hypothetical protein
VNKKFEYVRSENGEYIMNGKIQKPGLKLPNELGLFDMNGNVNEICIDEKGNFCYKGGSTGDDIISYQKQGYEVRSNGKIFGFRLASD